MDAQRRNRMAVAGAGYARPIARAMAADTAMLYFPQTATA